MLEKSRALTAIKALKALKAFRVRDVIQSLGLLGDFERSYILYHAQCDQTRPASLYRSVKNFLIERSGKP